MDNILSKKKACKVCFKGAQGSSPLIEYYYLYTRKFFTWKFDNSSCDFQEEILVFINRFHIDDNMDDGNDDTVYTGENI